MKVNKGQPMACVLGDMDLVRPLALAGIDCVVAVPPGAPPRYSRYNRETLEWASPWEAPEQLLENLIRFGATQEDKPVLFFESDGELLFVSRNRERLSQYFRFALPAQKRVEDLVDKERFQNLALRLDLPVPAARRLELTEDPSELNLRYPIIVKPLTRRPQTWKAVAKAGKAVRVNNLEELKSLWPRFFDSGLKLIAQELIPGPETSVESYHCYVNAHGTILGEFTGRKIRTFPLEFGDSTAVMTTNQPDVTELGRELVKRLSFTGVAKFDFKRSADGTLHLMEINPRFNLWHHVGAVAGVNLPAIVYADLIGLPTPPGEAQPGLRWCCIWLDALAARDSRLSLVKWLPWALSCETKRLLTWDDPMPFIQGVLWRIKFRLQSQITKLTAFRPDVGATGVEKQTPRPELT